MKQKSKQPHLRVYRQIPMLQADPAEGLSPQEIKLRQSNGLSNIMPPSNTKSEGQIIKENVLTFFNLIFLVLALCLCLVGSFKNLMFLLVAVANTVVGSFQEIRAKRAVDKLTLVAAGTAKAIRSGQRVSVRTDQLVRDDIVEFAAGDQICADAVVRDGQLQVNESLLTGEADAILKNPGDTLKSGSFVISGRARVQLTHVGSESYAAKLAAEARRNVRSTKSEMMLSLTKLITVVGIALIPLGIILFLRHFLSVFQGLPLRDSVESTVSALIGMIPEGLYLLTSVAIAASCLKLSRKRVLVQDMNCIETLAHVDVLCVDKTGTITEPKMTVDDIVPLQPERYIADDIRMIMADYVCAMQDDNDTMAALRRYFTGQSMQTAIDAVPFRSAKKYGGVSFHEDETYLLGAPEILLANCPEKEQYLPLAEEWSAKGCRVLLLALYDGKLSDEALDAEMMPLALILLSNKIRPEAPQTFSYFAQQGVRTKVISGDNPLTVSEVARRAGIPDAEKFVDARTLKTDAELAKAAEDMTVFGRVTPDQKKKLVAAMKRAGHTVAMTGDGVNDVLALREADCSIAMASGSGVACQASHIVLLDSQFSALPSVVAEGRRVINNIERSAALFLVKNIFSLFLALITISVGVAYPLQPVHLTLINIFTIGIPSFFLALEPNENRIRGQFMSSVLYRAAPSGFTNVFLVGFVLAYRELFHMDAGEVGTVSAILIGFVGMMMLYRVCQPFNLMRRILWIALLVGLTVSCFVSSVFTSDVILSRLSVQSILVLLTFLLMAYPVMRVLSDLEKKAEVLYHRAVARLKRFAAKC